MKKKAAILILIFSLGIILVLFGDRLSNNFLWYHNKESKNKSHLQKKENIYLEADELIPSKKDTESINHNTKYLQQLIDQASNNGGGTVHIPSGTYYFSAGGNNRTFEENDNGGYYVIKCRDNVLVEGSGMDEKSGTILMPLGTYYHGLDMFWYEGNRSTYIVNADFKDFIIDGSLATKNDEAAYNARGKGFMLSPVKDCDWDSVMVKNTDGTGFGMDLPINCTIKNCIAIGNGKATDEQGIGASGFGIGTGLSEKESMYISNCLAIGNRKFGFFFEHQGRWNAYPELNAKVANGSNLPNSTIPGFVVENSVARGNMYDFGGEKANDVTFKNCISEKNKDNDPNPLGNTNYTAYYFGLNFRRIHLTENKVEYKFDDIDNTNNPAISWAINNGIIDIGARKTTISPNNSIIRAEAIALLWKISDRQPGEVLLNADVLSTGYTDIPDVVWYQADWYVDAVLWGVQNGILKSTGAFNPTKECNKADFMVMLYRLAGEPKVNTSAGYEDVRESDYYWNAVNWAYSKGLISKPNTNLFNPTGAYTKIEAVTILYKYENLKHIIIYDAVTNGGTAIKDNTEIKEFGEKVNLNKVAQKEGYTFVGWSENPNDKEGTKEIIVKDKDIHLYAIYKKTVELQFIDYNGKEKRTRKQTIEFYNNETNTAIAPEIGIYSGYEPRYWTTATTEDAIGTITSNSKIPVTSNTTYYARYRKIVKVTYNLNGGQGLSPSPTELTLEVNSYQIDKIKQQRTFITEIEPTLENYEFKGWNTKKDGSGKNYLKSQEIIIDNDLELYANWEAKDYLDMSALNVDEQNKYIYNLELGISINDIIQKIKTNGEIKYLNRSGEELSTTAKVTTGYLIQIELNNLCQQYTLIVSGDIRSTGTATMDDIIKIANHMLEEIIITEKYYLKAADVTNDGNIHMNDIMRIANYILEGGNLT